MSLFLRVVRQGRWLRFPDIPWLPVDELQADALSDLTTEKNGLSVYRVEGDGDRQRIIIALAATRDKPGNLDYVIFDDANMLALGITPEYREGETPDQSANKLHWELRNLTVNHLSGLATILAAGEHERVQKKVIKARLRGALRSSLLERRTMKRSLLDALEDT